MGSTNTLKGHLISADETGNSTKVLLASGATFTGNWENVVNYTTVGVSILGSIPTDGVLWIDVRKVGSTNVNSVSFNYPDVSSNETNLPSIWNIVKSEVRIRYINGTTAQTGEFDIETKYSNGQELTLLQTAGGEINENTTVQISKSILVGVDIEGQYKNVPIDEDGSLSVSIKDQTTRSIDFLFGRIDNLTITTSQANIEDRTLTLSSTTGFVDGTVVGVFDADDPNVFYLGTQIGAPVGNVITLDTPIDQTLVSGSSVASTTTNMAVDGSSVTQKFQIGPVGPGSTQIVDITRIMGNILDSSTMDDGKFGGLPALTNGVVLRLNNSVIQNIWNVKKNADLKLICHNFTYSDKAPGGQFGCNWRNTYAGQSSHGVVIELLPGDFLEILVQDDLTGLDDFKMMAQGHFRF